MTRSRIKTALAILAILLLALPAASCTRPAEEGTIEDIEIDVPAEEETGETFFTKTDSPYSYEYTTFTVSKAHMRFDVPSTWSVKTVNSRFITMRTPDDDGYLPGVTINLLCNYGDDVANGDYSEYTLNDHAYNFTRFFKLELEGLPFNVNGKSVHLRQYVAEDEIRNAPDFADEDHKNDAATLTANSVVLTDNTGRYYTGSHGMVSSYIKWDNSPYCLTAVVPIDYIDNAKLMLEYITSSINYVSSDKLQFGSVSYEDFRTLVPVGFLPIEGAENVFVSPLTNNSETAGMTVGIFRMEKDSDSLANADGIKEYFGEQIAKLAYDVYDTNVIYDINAEEYFSSDGSGPTFKGVIGMNCTGYEDPTEIAGSVFGMYSLYNADYYVIRKDNADYLIAVIYQDCQQKLADIVAKTAVDSFTID